MSDNFELEVVSQLPQFSGKVLKPWFLDGIDTVGVWGEEPFELRFKNNTGQKVQVRLSVDGTDVLTGKKAHTNTDNEGMWVVNAYGSMSLKAWPETNQKGRSFMFGKTGDSVAAHTHGDLSSKGIIAAAIFTEAHKPYVPSYTRFREDYWGGGYSGGRFLGGGGIPGVYGEIKTDSRSTSKGYGAGGGGTIGAAGIGDVQPYQEYAYAVPAGSLETFNLVNDPAVGAGVEIQQAIGKAQGLITPKLDRIVKVRYVWDDDLKAMLSKKSYSQHYHFKFHPSGFPGDREETLANLGSTPTMGVKQEIDNHRFR